MSEPAPNPFFALQERLKALLEAEAYFAGVTILTEKIGDLESAISGQIMQLGFGVVVTTGKGDADADAVLRLKETLVVSIVHCASLEQIHSALDALAAAIRATHGKPVDASAPPPRSHRERFAVIGHLPLPADQVPEGVHIHQLLLSAPLVGAFA